ncbi:MAG: MFS transporter [Clostridiales bacterium]|nr:MFS transporter [Clostridiales bacterium]
MKLKIENIKSDYRHTAAAGYISFVTQAVVNNFAPLLFVTFQKDYGITLGQVAFISTYNFLIQLLTDMLSAKFADKIGAGKCMIFAHISAAAGLVGLGTLPYVMSNKFAAILLSITVYAFGGGLIEVLASPLIEACPTENKEANMSLLHSFYCWGQVITVLASTVFFLIFDISSWRYMAYIWAVIPALNAVYFSLVPIPLDTVESREGSGSKTFLKSGLFYILIVMMLCSGASEQAISQWASAFAEEGLGVSKAAGDIAGACMFGVTMGAARTVYARFSKRLPLEKYILFCAFLCCAGYLLTALSPIAYISLAGCGICGFAVGIMWPGTYSVAAKSFDKPSTSLFALLALAGDCGCSGGPYIVGKISEMFGDNLKSGILAGTAFPVVMAAAVLLLLKYQKKQKSKI